MRAGRSEWRAWAALAMATMSIVGLASCNTIEGAGRDIEALGRTLADSAERARR